jgi:hypothetical protein
MAASAAPEGLASGGGLGLGCDRATGMLCLVPAREGEAFEVRVLTATIRLEPDMDSAAISGRRTSPKTGSKTPAAMGRAMAL